MGEYTVPRTRQLRRTVDDAPVKEPLPLLGIGRQCLPAAAPFSAIGKALWNTDEGREVLF